MCREVRIFAGHLQAPARAAPGLFGIEPAEDAAAGAAGGGVAAAALQKRMSEDSAYATALTPRSRVTAAARSLRVSQRHFEVRAQPQI